MALRGRTRKLLRAAAASVCAAVACAPGAEAAPPTGLTYPIVYVRMPRLGDEVSTRWPDVARPTRIEPGSDLVLLRPDGTEEVLAAGGVGAVMEPAVSFDAQWVYYTRIHDARTEALTEDEFALPRSGADLYRVNVSTRETQRLTFGEFTPALGAGAWDLTNPAAPAPGKNGMGFGVINLGACPLPPAADRPDGKGRIAFVSNRNGYRPPKTATAAVTQLFVMDEDGTNVELIGPMSLSGALSPMALQDGRILFATHENQGNRDSRLWSLWAIRPDGTHWDPVVSAFRNEQAWHYAAQLSDGDLLFGDYYHLSNYGAGGLYRARVAPGDGTVGFMPSELTLNPAIPFTNSFGVPSTFRMSFSPLGMTSVTPFTHSLDLAAPAGSGGVRVGKFTHPAAAPEGKALVAWSPGPMNQLERPSFKPAPNSGIFQIEPSGPVLGPYAMRVVRDDPNYNEAFPRALVPYSAIHGVASPARLARASNAGTAHAALPAGTPFGLVGASTVIRRDTAPRLMTWDTLRFDLLDPFNSDRPSNTSNWMWQGADAGRYTDADVYAVRIVAMDPTSARNVGPNAGTRFFSHAGERMRILGEIPLKKTGPGGQTINDPEGRPDSSFLAKIPADTPFTLQTIDKDGMVLNMAQTWRQLRPGEIRTDCGSCHAHGQPPLPFAQTVAGGAAYQPTDLTRSTPLLTKNAQGQTTLRTENTTFVSVEFYRDIRPILARSCVSCHTGSSGSPAGGLALDDYTMINGLPGDYVRLARDEGAAYGPAPVGASGWRLTNASRYIRKFQSRRSLLVWKILGRRTDGWTNADHPTETIPGNASTLPAGVDPAHADLDFTGTIMPPAGSGVPALSEDEKMLIVRWIDLGCPIDFRPAGQPTALGYFLDEQRPTLTVSAPPAGASAAAIGAIRIGAFDGLSGIAPGSLSVRADAALAGRAAGSELADLATQTSDGAFAIALSPAIRPAVPVTLTVRVKDAQGNESVVNRTFWTTRLGDLTGDGRTDARDLTQLLALWGTRSQAMDLSGDGLINAADLQLLLGAWGAGASPDITGDGRVDASDLTMLLSAWGTASVAADLTGNGRVDSADLTVLLGAWTR